MDLYINPYKEVILYIHVLSDYWIELFNWKKNVFQIYKFLHLLISINMKWIFCVDVMMHKKMALA